MSEPAEPDDARREAARRVLRAQRRAAPAPQPQAASQAREGGSWLVVAGVIAAGAAIGVVAAFLLGLLA
jgi:cytochrome c-type biogenesis protein CcmH/NrfG